MLKIINKILLYIYFFQKLTKFSLDKKRRKSKLRIIKNHIQETTALNMSTSRLRFKTTNKMEKNKNFQIKTKLNNNQNQPLKVKIFKISKKTYLHLPHTNMMSASMH